MAEETVVESGKTSKCQELVTLTLDLVMLHTIMHHSLTYHISLKSKKPFCGWMDIHKDGRTDLAKFKVK